MHHIQDEIQWYTIHLKEILKYYINIHMVTAMEGNIIHYHVSLHNSHHVFFYSSDETFEQ